MLIYWFMFLIPMSMALFVGHARQKNVVFWFFIGFLFIFIIGFRDEIGCDWFNYVRHYERTLDMAFLEIFNKGKDPGHAFVNWLMGQWEFGIYGVNFIYAIIFVIGLIVFSRKQMYPWLALTVAVPYMVVMVSMGYSRQGVALGFFMLAITYIEEGKFKSYVFWVLMATLFHKSAIILLPFGLFLSKGGIWLRILIMIPVFYGGWDLLLAEKQEELWKTYVEQQMQSSGAYIRVFMNFVPAILFFIYRKKWKQSYADYPFWFWIAIGSIVSMLLVNEATTAVDRIALYFIPLQLAVFSRLPYLMRNSISPNIAKLIIILGYAMVLFVWLSYATHSHCWMPYQNMLFKEII